MAYERDPSELGALWIKEGKKGKYLSGTIEGVGAVVVFKNERKNSDKAPDYRVLRSKPRDRAPEEEPPW